MNAFGAPGARQLLRASATSSPIIWGASKAALSPSQQRAYPIGLALLVGGVLILAGKKDKEA